MSKKPSSLRFTRPKTKTPKRYTAVPDEQDFREAASYRTKPATHTPKNIKSPSKAAFSRRTENKPSGNHYWLYGLHPVEAALLNPQRNIQRILLTNEAELHLSGRLQAMASSFRWPAQPEIVEKTTLTHLCGEDAVHQGAALLTSPLPQPDITDIIHQQAAPLLVLDQVTDPRNIGAILRSAAAFGAGAVIMQIRHAPTESGVLAKAASGALEKIPLLQVVNLSRTLDALKKAGYWIIGMEVSEHYLNGAQYQERLPVLVLGAEGSGLRRLVKENCDELAGLKIHNQMESLNVSNAAAIGLYELTRQHLLS